MNKPINIYEAQIDIANTLTSKKFKNLYTFPEDFTVHYDTSHYLTNNKIKVDIVIYDTINRLSYLFHSNISHGEIYNNYMGIYDELNDIDMNKILNIGKSKYKMYEFTWHDYSKSKNMVMVFHGENLQDALSKIYYNKNISTINILNVTLINES
jgi:hypothetical protein